MKERPKTSITVRSIGNVNLSTPFEIEGVFGDLHSKEDADANTWQLSQGHVTYRGPITLKEMVTLLQSYLFSGKDVTQIFKRMGSNMGIVTADASYFVPGEHGGKTKWTVHPERFDLHGDVWMAIPGIHSRECLVDLPGSGYVEMTDEGLFHHEIGTPLSTVESEKEALDSYRRREISLEGEQVMGIYFHNGGYDGRIVKGAASVGFWKAQTDKTSYYAISTNLDPGAKPLLNTFPVERTLAVSMA
jgi:hypothetical protein